VHFKRNRALVAESDAEREDDPRATSTSDDNSSDNQACVAAEMVGPAADAAHFATEKASLNIGEISYIAFQCHTSSPDWIYDTGATAYMTDQINAFKSDPQVNESGRRRVTVGGRSLLIRGRGTISVKLV
jgi:hypothetical protein